MGGGAAFEPNDLRKPLDVKHVKMQHPANAKIEYMLNPNTKNFKHSRWYSFTRNRKVGMAIYGATLLSVAVWWLELQPVISRLPVLRKIEFLQCFEPDALTQKYVREVDSE